SRWRNLNASGIRSLPQCSTSLRIYVAPHALKLVPESLDHLQILKAKPHPARAGTTSFAAWHSCDGPAARRSAPHQRSTPLATIAPPAYNPAMPAATRHGRISPAVAASPPPVPQQTSLQPGD